MGHCNHEANALQIASVIPVAVREWVEAELARGVTAFAIYRLLKAGKCPATPDAESVAYITLQDITYMRKARIPRPPQLARDDLQSCLLKAATVHDDVDEGFFVHRYLKVPNCRGFRTSCTMRRCPQMVSHW